MGAEGEAALAEPMALALSPDGSTLFTVDEQRIMRVVVETGKVTTLAGSNRCADEDGIGVEASFCDPYGVVISADGSSLFVADQSGRKIRKVDVATAAVTTLAGSGDLAHKMAWLQQQ